MSAAERRHGDAPKMRDRSTALNVMFFETASAFAAWLDEHHDQSPGLWLRIPKKSSGVSGISYAEALEEALRYGWIDGQKNSESDSAWLQKFTPRSKRSVWSKINREKALRLIESGRMKPAGLAEVERAKQDGRWEAAYDAQSKAVVPPDLQSALDSNPRANAFFNSLDSRNRYAVLFRIHHAKRPETRRKRIDQFVAMLERGEKLH